MKTRNPSHQTSEGYRLEAIFPWLLLLVKNACIMEAKTVNVSTEFIIRDIAQQTCGRAHRETVCLDEKEARQRCTPGEKGCGCPP